MTNYDIKSFGNGLIGNIARNIDKYSTEENKGKLDGKEISLFSSELSKKGIAFDFSKLNDASYIEKVEKEYKNALDKAFSSNPRADKVIEENKGNYSIKKIYNQNYNGSYTACYEITAKVDVNLSRLKEDLDIPAGVISDCNYGYDQWDGPGGTYIDNKPMKNVTIKIPADKLGANPNIIERLIEYIFG